MFLIELYRRSFNQNVEILEKYKQRIRYRDLLDGKCYNCEVKRIQSAKILHWGPASYDLATTIHDLNDYKNDSISERERKNSLDTYSMKQYQMGHLTQERLKMNRKNLPNAPKKQAQHQSTNKKEETETLSAKKHRINDYFMSKKREKALEEIQNRAADIERQIDRMLPTEKAETNGEEEEEENRPLLDFGDSDSGEECSDQMLILGDEQKKKLETSPFEPDESIELIIPSKSTTSKRRRKKRKAPEIAPDKIIDDGNEKQQKIQKATHSVHAESPSDTIMKDYESPKNTSQKWVFFLRNSNRKT